MHANPIRSLAFAAAALLLAACGGGRDPETAVDDNLDRDLELASSAGVQLAPSTGALQVVSAVERSPERAATSTRAPRPSPRRGSAPAPKAATVESPEPDEAELAEQGTAVAEAPAEAPSETPQAIPTSYPGPVAIGEGDHGAGGDGGFGGAGTGTGTGTGAGPGPGVIIRGGGIGDDDHCEIHPRSRRPRSSPPVVIGRQPTGGGNFPVWGAGTGTRSGGTRGGSGGIPVWGSGARQAGTRTPAATPTTGSSTRSSGRAGGSFGGWGKGSR